VVDWADVVIVKENIMSAKELVLKTVRKMSDKLSMEEILDELAILAAIREGEDAADAGKMVSHDEIKARASLEAVRQVLGKTPDTIAQVIHADREDR